MTVHVRRLGGGKTSKDASLRRSLKCNGLKVKIFPLPGAAFGARSSRPQAVFRHFDYNNLRWLGLAAPDPAWIFDPREFLLCDHTFDHKKRGGVILRRSAAPPPFL